MFLVKVFENCGFGASPVPINRDERVDVILRFSLTGIAGLVVIFHRIKTGDC